MWLTIWTCSYNAHTQGPEALCNGKEVQSLNISFKPKVPIWLTKFEFLEGPMAGIPMRIWILY